MVEVCSSSTNLRHTYPCIPSQPELAICWSLELFLSCNALTSFILLIKKTDKSVLCWTRYSRSFMIFSRIYFQDDMVEISGWENNHLHLKLQNLNSALPNIALTKNCISWAKSWWHKSCFKRSQLLKFYSVINLEGWSHNEIHPHFHHSASHNPGCWSHTYWHSLLPHDLDGKHLLRHTTEKICSPQMLNWQLPPPCGKWDSFFHKGRNGLLTQLRINAAHVLEHRCRFFLVVVVVVVVGLQKLGIPTMWYDIHEKGM